MPDPLAIIKRFNALETAARSAGLSLATAQGGFVLRRRDNGMWRHASTLDGVEAAIHAYEQRRAPAAHAMQDRERLASYA